MARIAVAGFHHETNCFVLPDTAFAYFCSHRDRPPLVRGPEVLEWLAQAGYPLTAVLAECGARHDIVPLLWTSGGAGGMVKREAFERIAGEIVGALSRAMPVDAVYLDLHGAMVTEDFEDGEGELLRRVRAVVGPALPLVVSLDYHANVTPQMATLSDAVLAYRTYPHVDRVETGSRAAAALERILRHGRPAGRALRKPGFLVPLHAQCTLGEPCAGIVAEAARLETGGVLSAAFLAGFPPADLFHCGPAIVVHAERQEEADAAADALVRRIAVQEPDFAQPLLDPSAAVREAMRIAAGAGRPVILADTQDNPGAGGNGDTTGLLRALVAAGAEGAVLGFLFDPEAARRAHAAGEGSRVALALGGRSDSATGEPLRAEFAVERLGSGRFTTTGPVAGGRSVDLGPMGLLRTGGVAVAVTSKRMQAYDQAPFRHLGVEPAAQRILALKSSVHFRADFEALAEAVLVVAAPGAHLADSTRYPYNRLRAGIRLAPLGPESAGPVPGPRRFPAG